MKLVDWRIEGFGCFENCTTPEGGLSGGLNLVIGPNEAGKSTLLDFVRFTLFGYPRRQLSWRKPLRGGRHGGDIIYTVDGATFQMHRAPGKNNFRLTDQNGNAYPEKVAQDHLARVTKATFENIFGFSLEELQQAKSLESGNDLLFSAAMGKEAEGIIAAESTLGGQAERLFKEHAKDGPNAPLLVRLASNIKTLRRDLTELRQSARELPAQLTAQAALDAKLADTNALLASLQQEQVDLQRLIDGWPHYQRIIEGAPKLSAGFPLVVHVSTVRNLGNAKNSYALAGQAVESKSEQLMERRAEWDNLVQALGPDWDQSVVADLDVSLLAENAGEDLAASLSEAQTGLNDAEQQIGNLRRDIQELRNQIELETGLFPDLAERSFEREQVEKSRSQVGFIRDAVEERSGLIQQFDRAKAEFRTVQMQFRSASSKWTPPQMILRLLSVALGIAAGWSFASGYSVVGVVTILLSLVAFFVALRGYRGGHDEEKPAEQRVTEAEDALKKHDEKWRLISGGEDLDWPLSSGLLSQRERQLETAAKIATLQTNIQQKEIALQTAEVARSSAAAVAKAAADAWQRFLEERRLPSAMRSTTVRELFERLRNGKRVLAIIAQLSRDIHNEARTVEEYLVLLRDFLKKLKVSDADNCAKDTLLSLFDDWANVITAQDASQKELKTKVDTARETLETMFGTSGTPKNFVKRWQDDDPGTWKREQQEIATKVREVSEQRDNDLRNVQIATTEIEKALNSSRIAQLELDHSAAEQEFEQTLSDWCRVATALELLRQTRTQFEQNHQPKALEYASRLFERITAGRYKRVIMPLESKQLRVMRDKGGLLELTDLSRGTVEEFYLCARLGYVQHLARDQQVELPFLMDDVTVNFDPDRLGRAVQLIGECADAGQQIVLFTCHPELKQMAGENARCFELRDCDFVRVA